MSKKQSPPKSRRPAVGFGERAANDIGGGQTRAAGKPPISATWDCTALIKNQQNIVQQAYFLFGTFSESTAVL